MSNRWVRGLLLGVGMLVVMLLLTRLAFPLRESRLKMLYLPGGLVLLALGGGQPGVGADIDLILSVVTWTTVVFYSLVASLLGVVFRSMRSAAVACVVLLVLALGGAGAFDILMD